MHLEQAQGWTLTLPTICGSGLFAERDKHCLEAVIGHHLLVTDRGSHGLPFIDHTLNILSNNGLEPTLISGISANPRGDEIGLSATAPDILANTALRDAAAPSNPSSASREEIRSFIEFALGRRH